MTKKHTPTPWRVDPMYWADIQTADGGIEVAGLRYDGMPDAINREPEDAVARANAAFIVRAVNHHEALVEMVRVMSQDETDDPAAHMRAYAIAKHRARILLAGLDADNA